MKYINVRLGVCKISLKFKHKNGDIAGNKPFNEIS